MAGSSSTLQSFAAIRTLAVSISSRDHSSIAPPSCWCGHGIIFSVNRRRFKLTIVVLLLALPLQAFAAASMLFCGRVTHDTWLGETVAALSDHRVGQFAQAAQRHQSDHHDGVVGHHHDGDGAQLKHLAESCSTCSDCCCPTTLPSAERTSLAFGDSISTQILFVAHAIPDSAPERLERPPRNTLV